MRRLECGVDAVDGLNELRKEDGALLLHLRADVLPGQMGLEYLDQSNAGLGAVAVLKRLGNDVAQPAVVVLHLHTNVARLRHKVWAQGDLHEQGEASPTALVHLSPGRWFTGVYGAFGARPPDHVNGRKIPPKRRKGNISQKKSVNSSSKMTMENCRLRISPAARAAPHALCHPTAEVYRAPHPVRNSS